METVADITRYYRRLAMTGKTDPDFFEFVRRIESATGERQVGKSTGRRREPVRFGQAPHLTCPSSMIAEISERARLTLFVYFFGLWGPNGPMPLDATGYVYQRMHNHGDQSPRRFADILHHRFLGLYYRAWKANEQAVGFDKPDGGLIASVVTALAGASATGSDLDPFTDANWAGLFGSAVKSRDGLETLLSFSFPRFRIRIHDHVECVRAIPQDARGRLGGRGVSEVGVSLQIGSTFTTRTRKFRIEVGECPFHVAAALLPGRKGYRRLVRLVTCYLDRPLDWDIVIRLRQDSIPPPRLDGILALGRSLWLGGARKSRGELVIGASRLIEAAHARGESY